MKIATTGTIHTRPLLQYLKSSFCAVPEIKIGLIGFVRATPLTMLVEPDTVSQSIRLSWENKDTLNNAFDSRLLTGHTFCITIGHHL